MGPPHPSRRALRDACVSGKRICLRPPQDEAIACPSDSFPARNAFSPSEPSTSSVGRKKSLRCLPVSAHRAGFVEDWAAWVEGSGGCHCSDTLGRYHADKITHVIWRHAVGNVGPSVRSPILKCWQCGPAPQWLACGSSGSSLQTAAITSSVVDAREPAALPTEAAAANRSAALIAIVTLFDISRLLAGDVLATCGFRAVDANGYTPTYAAPRR